MKEYMEGVRYDTNKAEHIASHWGTNHQEMLYRTLKGHWVLVYEFKAPGTAMNPLTEAQAESWMRDHQLMDALDECFPGKVEDA